MDIIEVIKLLTNTPLAMLLLYLLVKEQHAHAETRKARDEENHIWIERFAAMAERVANAVESIEDRKILARITERGITPQDHS